MASLLYSRQNGSGMPSLFPLIVEMPRILQPVFAYCRDRLRSRIAYCLLFPASVKECEEQRGIDGVVFGGRYHHYFAGIRIEQEPGFKSGNLALDRAQL